MTALLLALALAAPASAQPDPHGRDPQMAQLRRILDRELATANPSRDVPAGAIRVLVVDDNERPVPMADVQIGIMTQDQTRDRRVGQAGADGVAWFRDLPRGTGQAYRVNVPHARAMYSSTPFQLPMNEGYDVKIVRLETTTDDRAILQFVSEVLIELKDERVHVVHRVQLVNLGERTYVFPENGTTIRLPEGFLAFQSQPVMTDQKIDPVEDVGLKIRGSLAPGRVTLVWGYDLRIPGSEMSFPVEVPFRTYIFAVAAQAPRGLELSASGLPPAELRTDQGERMLVTNIQRSPDDPPLGRVTVRLAGIPGPGPWRWMAVVVAFLLVLAGGLWALLDGRSPEASAPALAQRRKELLEEAKAIEQQHAEGEIGPVYRERRLEKVIVELAAVLREEAARKKSPPASRSH